MELQQTLEQVTDDIKRMLVEERIHQHRNSIYQLTIDAQVASVTGAPREERDAIAAQIKALWERLRAYEAILGDIGETPEEADRRFLRRVEGP